jgi:hypothetical protein
MAEDAQMPKGLETKLLSAEANNIQALFHLFEQINVEPSEQTVENLKTRHTQVLQRLKVLGQKIQVRHFEPRQTTDQEIEALASEIADLRAIFTVFGLVNSAPSSETVTSLKMCYTAIEKRFEELGYKSHLRPPDEPLT